MINDFKKAKADVDWLKSKFEKAGQGVEQLKLNKGGKGAGMGGIGSMMKLVGF